MTVRFPTYLTAVETAGVAVLPVTWSDKLCQRLATMTADRLSVRVLREAFEGLPMRIAQALAGEQVFSGAGVGVPAGWHRQRLDTVAAGAPSNFLPGVCVAGPVSSRAVDLDYVPGSARLPADAAVPEDLTAGAQLSPRRRRHHRLTVRPALVTPGAGVPALSRTALAGTRAGRPRAGRLRHSPARAALRGGALGAGGHAGRMAVRTP